MRSVKLGVIGCGAIAQGAHLPIISVSEREELVAVCDVRSTVAERVAHRFNCGRFYTKVEDLLDDDEIEAVVIGVYHDLHAPIAVEALRRGKHVLVEKPLAMRLDDAEWMIDEAAKAQRRLMVGYMWRYDPGAELAHTLYRQGRFGQANYATAGGEEGPRGWEAGALDHLITSDERVPDIEVRRPGWCEDPFANFAYEYLVDAGSHTIDLLRHFLGEPERVCYTDVYRMPKGKDGAKTVRVLTVLQFPGATVFYNVAFLTQDITGMGMRLHSDKGWLDVQFAPTLTRHVPAAVTSREYDTGIIQTHNLAPGWSFEREHEHFVDAITSDQEPLTSAANCLGVVRTCEAIIESWLQKTEITLKGTDHAT